MPFASVEHEIYMMINHPELWKSWVSKYGHHSKFESRMKRKTSKRRKNEYRRSKRRKKR